MSRTHKDLPGGSQSWAEDVTGYRARIDELEAIVRRMANDFGLDYSNPTRGLNTGNTPSVQKNVELKLPSLKDLEIRDAQDGDLLTFDGKRGVWVARRHNTVQLPKVFPQGDPASYYVPAVPTPVAGVWSSTTAYTNYMVNPSFESGTAGWRIANDWYNSDFTNVAKAIDWVPIGASGSHSLMVTLGASSNNGAGYNGVNYISFPNLPDGADWLNMQVKLRMDLPNDYGLQCYAEVYVLDATGTVVAGGNDPDTSQQLGDAWKTLTISDTVFSGYGTGYSKTLLLRFGGNWEGAAIDNAKVYVDCVLRSTSQTYFDGDGGSDTSLSYSWSGTPHNSPSIATSTRQINVPEIITLGQAFTVTGRGFPAGASVDVYESYWYAANSTVTVAADGTFTTTLTIPANTDPNVGPVAGQTDTIEASQTGTNFTPSVTVTYK